MALLTVMQLHTQKFQDGRQDGTFNSDACDDLNMSVPYRKADDNPKKISSEVILHYKAVLNRKNSDPIPFFLEEEGGDTRRDRLTRCWQKVACLHGPHTCERSGLMTVACKQFVVRLYMVARTSHL